MVSRTARKILLRTRRNLFLIHEFRPILYHIDTNTGQSSFELSTAWRHFPASRSRSGLRADSIISRSRDFEGRLLAAALCRIGRQTFEDD